MDSSVTYVAVRKNGATTTTNDALIIYLLGRRRALCQELSELEKFLAQLGHEVKKPKIIECT